MSATTTNNNLTQTYTYIRTAMVGLLIALGVAVFYETWRQGSFLSSVSAYYYSPAQPIFVGSLIALAACMIALRGTNSVEDVFLNLGGVGAAFVAIVPTSRGSDYSSAYAACRELAGTAQFDQLKCPDTLALADGTRANVENNLLALLVLGALALVAAVYFARGGGRRTPTTAFWLGWGAAVVLWALALLVRFAYLDWGIRNLHLVGAFGLLLCVIVVAFANAVRRKRQSSGSKDSLARAHREGDRYVILAWAMIVAAVVGTPLVLMRVISVFTLEIVVALLFALFWMTQTIERRNVPACPPPQPASPVAPSAAA